MTQFSLFGAAAAEPTLDDLDGVLLAGGHWVRSAGATARLSVVVADRWRADALAAEFDRARRRRGRRRRDAAEAASGCARRSPPALAAGRSALEPGRQPGAAGRLRARRRADCGCGRSRPAAPTTAATCSGRPSRTTDPPGRRRAVVPARGSPAVSLGRAAARAGGSPRRKRLRRLAELLGAAPAGRRRAGLAGGALNMPRSAPARRRPVPSAGGATVAGDEQARSAWQARARGRAPSW